MRSLMVGIEAAGSAARRCKLQFLFHSESESIADIDRYDVINVNTLSIGFGGNADTHIYYSSTSRDLLLFERYFEGDRGYRRDVMRLYNFPFIGPTTADSGTGILYRSPQVSGTLGVLWRIEKVTYLV
jgi:hypothetical protein